MNIRIISLLACSICNSMSQAASEHLIWGKADQLVTPTQKQGLLQFKNTTKNLYQLKALEQEHLNPEHTRYQQYFKNIPIWGHELIVHKNKTLGDYVTGAHVSGIEKDINQNTSNFSAQEIESKILASVQGKVIYKNTEQIIYLDKNSKAHLAYHFSSYTNTTTSIAAPNHIVDAVTGDTLKVWDDLNRQKIGQGLGGNVFILPYRTGLFQHGASEKEIPSLGKFDVTVKGERCYVESSQVRVINAQEVEMDSGSFPVLNIVEFFKTIPTFSYPCNERTGYVNKNDGNTAPANYSFSSVNDTMYFAGVTLKMYKDYYGLSNPIGDDLPLRAYTHIKNYDNAFAVPTIKIKGIYLLHQQIVIGDGDTMLTAPAQGTLAHELSHNVTRLYSNLIYQGQSGGINESFSDMASIAMQDYLRKDYPWYWDGIDFTVGSEATQNGKPLRFMDKPEQDGHSISNAKDYTDELDVHETSGVFNKAFYLLSNKPNWSVRKAFQVMLDANRYYWTSGTHYDAAACGVIQAAKDRHYQKSGVIEAFKAVGVVCPITI